MYRDSMFRYSILFLAGVGLVTSVVSCTQTTSTQATSDYHPEATLENMMDGTCRQLPSGLIWQVDKSDKFSTWKEANIYAESLSLGGFNDWRLPTREECLSLTDLVQMHKGDCPIAISGAHWVRESNKNKPGHWESNVLCDGPELRWTSAGEGSVRAVRP